LAHWKGDLTVKVDVKLLEGDDAENKGDNGDDKLVVVAHLDDVSVYPDIKPQPQNCNKRKEISKVGVVSSNQKGWTHKMRSVCPPPLPKRSP
jgi:hypothetical protein